jgi:hypothetical protein
MVIQGKGWCANKKLDDLRCKRLLVLVELVVSEVKLLMIRMIGINQTDKHYSYKPHVQLGNWLHINCNKWQLLRDRDL